MTDLGILLKMEVLRRTNQREKPWGRGYFQCEKSRGKVSFSEEKVSGALQKKSGTEEVEVYPGEGKESKLYHIGNEELLKVGEQNCNMVNVALQKFSPDNGLEYRLEKRGNGDL